MPRGVRWPRPWHIWRRQNLVILQGFEVRMQRPVIPTGDGDVLAIELTWVALAGSRRLRLAEGEVNFKSYMTPT